MNKRQKKKQYKKQAIKYLIKMGLKRKKIIKIKKWNFVFSLLKAVNIGIINAQIAIMASQQQVKPYATGGIVNGNEINSVIKDDCISIIPNDIAEKIANGNGKVNILIDNKIIGKVMDLKYESRT